MTQYVNGVVDGIDTANGLGDIDTSDGTSPRIGGRADGLDWDFEGLIDDVQIFDYAILPADVNTIDHVWTVSEEQQPDVACSIRQ